MLDKQKDAKQMFWYTLAFMAFSTVWSFANVINGYAYYGGLKAIISWILIFTIYFVPYSLMVGELGSTFKNSGGGVSSWINSTIGKTVAFYAGWTYWVVHMPYISQKPSRLLIAFSWLIFQDKRMSDMNVVYLQLISLVVFFVILFIASRGIRVLKKIAAVAGSSMFIMSILYIVMAITAPLITGADIVHTNYSVDTFMPTFDWKFFGSFSILVFAVGGCEKISPYVNKVKNPAKGFPKAMITLVIMVCFTAIIGTVALSLMFDTNNIPKDLVTNGAYYAFQRLGEWYGIGNFFLIIYALAVFIGQVSIMIISIDAPLRILIESTNDDYLPKSFFKQNKHGVYTNGLKLVAIIVSILIIIPMFGIGKVNELVRALIKLNAVCMPLRYLWVFVAYMALKYSTKNFDAAYILTKNKTFGLIIGGWCFLFTAYASISGMKGKTLFLTLLNGITPVVLVLLGVLMRKIAQKQKEKAV